MSSASFFSRIPIAILLILATDPSPIARAELADARRTRPFSGTISTVRGDIRTVGMAGATVGLGDTFIAAMDNPAGLAMTMNTGDFNVTSNWVRDSAVQDWENPLHSTHFGAALSPYPWGISFGYFTPYQEGQTYVNSAGSPTLLQAEIREYRVSFARVFLANRLSIGASLGLGQATEQYAPEAATSGTPPPPSLSSDSYTFIPSLGALLQLPRRLLVGMSYRFPCHYSGAPQTQTAGLPGFLQPITVPGRFGAGIGWIPNRFFRTDFSFFIIGSTPEAGLLRHEAITVGASTTLQPRLGAAYDFIDFRDFRATAFAGSYYETTRIDGSSNRLHVTLGFETKPWVLTIGTGADFASHYRNFLVTAGLDVIRAMQKMDLIPTPTGPTRGRILPDPTGLSDAGLARPLVAHWRPSGQDINPIQVGLELPRRIEKKARQAGKNLQDFTEDLFGGKK